MLNECIEGGAKSTVANGRFLPSISVPQIDGRWHKADIVECLFKISGVICVMWCMD